MKAYFISDLHLGASYIKDPRAHQERAVALLRRIAADATEVYLLGDIFDYWFEYRYVVPRGFVRFLGALAELSDAGVKITWLKGNHDMWMTDYLSAEIGVEIVDGVLQRMIAGKRFVMEHGDGVGRQPASFRFLRSVFRSSFLRVLYAAIHPRWTVGFAHAWSSKNRTHRPDADQPGEHTTLAADDSLIEFAEHYVREHGHVDYFVFGHRHLIVDMAIGDGSRLEVLGDGFRHYTYGAFDGKNFEILTF